MHLMISPRVSLLDCTLGVCGPKDFLPAIKVRYLGYRHEARSVVGLWLRPCNGRFSWTYQLDTSSIEAPTSVAQHSAFWHAQKVAQK